MLLSAFTQWGLKGREAGSKPKFNHCELVLPVLAEDLFNGATRGCHLTLSIASLFKNWEPERKGIVSTCLV